MKRYKTALFVLYAICLLSVAGCAGGSKTDAPVQPRSSGEREGQKENTLAEDVAQAEGEAQTETERFKVEKTGNVENPKKDDSGKESDTMKITIGNIVFTASLADNSSAQALKELLAKGPLTIDMGDYGDMEKVGPIGTELPRNDEQISTEPGDVILYQGNALVIYYDVNDWNFTRIGKINDVTQEELKETLGEDNVTVTFSLD